MHFDLEYWHPHFDNKHFGNKHFDNKRVVDKRDSKQSVLFHATFLRIEIVFQYCQGVSPGSHRLEHLY